MGLADLGLYSISLFIGFLDIFSTLFS